MSVAAKVGAHLPYLRRYARALSGSQAAGDAFVRATLEAALDDAELLAQLSIGRVELYAAFNQIWAGANTDAAQPVIGGNFHEQAAQAQLARITPLGRQALLLTTVEEFTSEETGRILARDVAEIDALIADAIAEIERETATSVLIIEDEPLISMQLEDLVADIGHSVIGTAATRTQAQQIFAEHRPGLVLADIQLADGSSGIDAVEDILKFGDVPVIFITAYPEKLLTGDRPEPTYLVTKPFQESTVRTAISQALFFGSSRPLA